MMEAAKSPQSPSQSPADPPQGCCRSNSPIDTFHAPTSDASIIEDLDSKLHQAAVYGQTLLARHEAYVSEAETRHRTDAITIGECHQKTAALEAENRRLQDENHNLNTHVEELSNALEESENRVKGLTSALKDTQNELARMRIMAAKADRLEQQIVQVEMERQILQDTVTKSEDERRHATVRWHTCERALREIEVEYENLKVEGQRAYEAQREVELRAARQRSIQASIENHRRQSAADERAGDHGALANFVKEILGDNAGLRLDVAESREMLVRSQADQEELRAQLQFTSPVLTGSSGAVSPALDLSTELMAAYQPSQPPTPQPQSMQAYNGPREVHIHHHTHLAPPAAPSAFSALSTSLPTPTPRFTRSARHSRQRSSRSSVKTLHSRHESTASSVPSTVFESASDAGYDTDVTSNTNITRPTSPEVDVPGLSLHFSPMDEILEKSIRPSNHRRRGSTESVLSVSGMDIHSAGPRQWLRGEPSQTGRPEVSRNHASAASVKAFAPGESAAGQALRQRLEERERQRNRGGYNPVRDTFGSLWPRTKKSQPVLRRSNARVITEVVDEEGLKECLEEE